MSSKARILAKGSVLRVFYFFTSAVVGLFLMPFIIHSLGDRMYGLWMVVASFLGFYFIFDFGLSSAVQRYISRAIGEKNYGEANLVVNTSLFLFSIIGLLALFISIIIVVVAPLFAKNIPEVNLFRQVILILGIGMAISFPMRTFSGVLMSHLRFDLYAYVRILALLTRAILIVIFLKMGYGILSLALITFITDLIGYVITFIFARKIAEYIIFSKALIDKTKIRLLFKYSSFSFITQIADKLRFNIDNFIIAGFLGLNLVTIYSIAARLIQHFVNFIISALGVMIPVFSQYEAKGDYASIREKFILTTKISSYLSVLIGGTLIIFGNAFIERWMGKDYLTAYPILIVLVVPITFALMQSPSIQLLFGISKHKFFAISNSAEGISNLILSLILVKKYGLMGVALGTVIPMVVVKLFIQPVYTCRVIKLGVCKYCFGIITPALLKSSTVIIIFWWMIKNSIISSYSSLLNLIFCEFVLFLPVVYFIGFNSIERNYFKKIVFSGK